MSLIKFYTCTYFTLITVFVDRAVSIKRNYTGNDEQDTGRTTGRRKARNKQKKPILYGNVILFVDNTLNPTVKTPNAPQFQNKLYIY